MRTLGWFGAVAVMSLAAVAGCSSEDKSTNPDTGGGGSVASGFQSSLGVFVSTYFESSQEGYDGLVAVLPYIAASLSAHPAGDARPEGGVTCFDGVVAGTTYHFNGSTYVAGPGTTTPTNAVRFVLYRLNGSSQPVLSDSIGFLEVRCTVVDSRRKDVGASLIANGLTPFQADGIVIEDPGSGSYTMNGYLAGPGAPLVPITLYGQYGAGIVSLYSDYQVTDLSLEVSTTDSLSTGRRFIGASAIDSAEPLYHLLFRLLGDVPSEALVTGAVYYGDDHSSGIDQLVACMDGGTLTEPTFAAPDEACNSLGYPIGSAMSAADLTAASAGYRQLLGVHETLTGLLIEVFGVPIP